MTIAQRPRLMTSNPDKIVEFSRLGLKVDIGAPSIDLREPIAEPHFVAAHKAFMSGNLAMCEDTRLDVDGAQVGIEARYLLARLPELVGRRALFACCLALSLGDECLVWEGSISGTLVDGFGLSGFGFDPFFSPDGANGLRLSELEQAGRKDEFSARAKACQAYAHGSPIAKFRHDELRPFSGPWQNDPSTEPSASESPTGSNRASPSTRVKA